MTAPAPNPGMLHEALDRVHVLNCQFDDHVAGHPVMEAYPELKATAEKIGEAMADFYQAIGVALHNAMEAA